MIIINEKSFEIFLTKEEISNEIQRLSSALNSDYKGKDVVFIAILNGSFMFASDLMKNVDLNCEITFVKVSSYDGTISTGKVNELIGLNSSITNKHIVILEDIVDTGLTIDSILPILEKENPLSIKICSLLFKKEAFKGITPPQYIGFTIPNKFVVGFGLDYNEKGRNLSELYQLKNNLI